MIQRRLKRYFVLRRLQSDESDDAEVTCCGRQFQTRATVSDQESSVTEGEQLSATYRQCLQGSGT